MSTFNIQQISLFKLCFLFCMVQQHVHAFIVNKNCHHKFEIHTSFINQPLLQQTYSSSRCRQAARIRQPVSGEMSTDSNIDKNNEILESQAFSSGYSTRGDLLPAIQEAFENAMIGMPKDTTRIDVVWISISSLYDGGVPVVSTKSDGTKVSSSSSPTVTVPFLLAMAQSYNINVLNIIGSTVSGCISSQVLASPIPDETRTSCQTVEFESTPSVSVTLAIVPDTDVTTFHISAPDLPDLDSDEEGEVSISQSVVEWKRSVGLSKLHSVYDKNSNPDPLKTSFYLLPAPSFTVSQIQSLLCGCVRYFPECQIAGGIASTVSSLSRARLFQWSAKGGGGTSGAGSSTSCYTDGCVGIAFQGDVQCQTLQALGAKPIGGIYQIVQGQDSTINLIQLDESATNAAKLEEDEEATDNDDITDDDDDEEDDVEGSLDAKAKMAQFYAKAQIPKPVLAEANFLMRTLSDDDQAFMRRQLLVGLEDYGSNSGSGGSSNRVASELRRLASGEGHRFRIYSVASAGMKDGSVTLPLISNVQVYKGQRLRFFVREPEFAMKEINALWLGYQQRMLNQQFFTSKKIEDEQQQQQQQQSTDDSTGTQTLTKFQPAACFIIPTLDRGSKFFQGQRNGYESSIASKVLSNVQSVSGFFSNGVVSSVTTGTAPKVTTVPASARAGVQGSASGYFLIGSWSGRPIYSAQVAAAAEEAAIEAEIAAAYNLATRSTTFNNDDDDDEEAMLLMRRKRGSTSLLEKVKTAAPRAENGELILKRREVNSGRALTVSTIEWSVAEKTARPSSALEGYMWDKETEIDRFRERVPLANLLSQCKLSLNDPTQPKPRDWAGPVRNAIAMSKNKFIIIPECKRIDPSSATSIRRRYDVSKIIREFTIAGAPALSVNCDAVLFGGSLDQLSAARTSASAAAIEKSNVNSLESDGVVVPPILASDLLLYPYQLYKLRLAGADAINIVVGALEQKDLLYLTKIASSVQLQVLATVTTEVQLEKVANSLLASNLVGIILSNRQLEDYSYDNSGEQVLRLLKSSALQTLREKYNNEILVLVEGRVGLIERVDDNGTYSTVQYMKELKQGGAMGAIIATGLASVSTDKEIADLLTTLQSA